MLTNKCFPVQEKDSVGLNEYLSSKGYTSVQLTKNAAGHLLCGLTINGENGIFILDTGAGGTIIELTLSDKFKLEHNLDSAASIGAGAGGSGLTVIPSHNNLVEIGDFVIRNFSLSLMSLKHVTDGLKQLGIKEDIVGVVGADILNTGRAIIDYSNMILYLK